MSPSRVDGAQVKIVDLNILLYAVNAEAAGNLTTDAHLAALTLSHDAVLVSSDLDFGRFRGLRWENPLRADVDPKPR